MRSQRILIALASMLALASVAALAFAAPGERAKTPGSGEKLADATYVCLVRHAERLDDSADSPLSEAGHERAKLLAEMFHETKVARIFSSDYVRTRDTVAPLAAEQGVTVEIYDAGDLESIAATLREARGVIVVAGHSNTTPQLVELLGGDPVSPIDHGEYDRMYKVGFAPGKPAHSDLIRFGRRYEP